VTAAAREWAAVVASATLLLPLLLLLPLPPAPRRLRGVAAVVALATLEGTAPEMTVVVVVAVAVMAFAALCGHTGVVEVALLGGATVAAVSAPPGRATRVKLAARRRRVGRHALRPIAPPVTGTAHVGLASLLGLAMAAPPKHPSLPSHPSRPSPTTPGGGWIPRSLVPTPSRTA